MSDADVYTADSVALLGYLAEALPSKVDEIFRRAEDEKVKVIIPTIALGETIFTLLGEEGHSASLCRQRRCRCS